MPNQTSWRGYLMVLGSALCFGSYGVWSRMLGHDFAIFFQGWVRSLLILAVLLPIFLLKSGYKPIFVRSNEAKWFWITMVFTVFTQVPLYFAFNHLALGTATLIFYSLFLITSYLVGWLFIGEKIIRIKFISMILALVGLLLTFGFSLATFSIGALLLAALNGVASGGEIATSKKSSHYYSSLQISTFSWIFIFLTHLPLSLLLGEHQLVPSLTSVWLAMLAYAATGLVGFWLAIEGFRYVDASIGGLIGLTEIIFSIIFGIVLFRDHLTVAILAGGALIILAAMLPDIYTLSQKHRGQGVELK